MPLAMSCSFSICTLRVTFLLSIYSSELWKYGENNNLCILNRFLLTAVTEKYLLQMIMLENSELLIALLGSS